MSDEGTKATVPQPPAPKPQSNGIPVEEFLSNSRLVKEKSRYAQAAFKTWIKATRANLVGTRQPSGEWEKLFTKFLTTPAQ